ncbi:MAG: RNA polymerase sigma factor, partial [Armatimonadota bacterium]
MPSDAELMTRAKRGDARAFGVIADRYKGWLRRLFYHLFWDWDEAEDAAQEVLLRLWLARERYEPRAKLSTYLFTIARNHWLGQRARANSRPKVVSLQEQFGPGAAGILRRIADEAPSPEDTVIRRYELFRIRRAIDEVPEKHRIVFILCHFEGLRCAEAAEMLGIPEGTVKSRLWHAIR